VSPVTCAVTRVTASNVDGAAGVGSDRRYFESFATTLPTQ
jgi:hypothetical protein